VGNTDIAPKSGGLFHYGWVIVVAAFIAYGLVYGTVFYSFSVFANPVATSLGVKPAAVIWAFTLFNIGSGIVGIFGGQLLARFPIKNVMMAGLVILAIGFLGASFAKTVPMFYAAYAVIIAFGAVIVAPMGASAIIANWFQAHRGRALTLATLGTSVGQFVLPPIAANLIADYSYQTTYQIFAALILVIGIPAMFLLVVDRPEHKGVEPVGGLPQTNGAPSAAPVPLSTGQVLGNPDFWIIAVAYGLTVVVYLAITAAIVPYGKATFGPEVFNVGAVTKLTLMMGAAAIVGKLVFAAITDRIGLRFTFWIAVALNFVSVALLVFAPTYDHMFFAAACTGASAGGVLPVWPGLIAQRFGRQRVAQVMGLMAPLVLSIQGLGAPIAAQLGYTSVFPVFIGFLILSVVLSWTLNKPGKAAAL
jgi:MFS family permease